MFFWFWKQNKKKGRLKDVPRKCRHRVVLLFYYFYFFFFIFCSFLFLSNLWEIVKHYVNVMTLSVTWCSCQVRKCTESNLYWSVHCAVSTWVGFGKECCCLVVWPPEGPLGSLCAEPYRDTQIDVRHCLCALSALADFNREGFFSLFFLLLFLFFVTR